MKRSGFTLIELLVVIAIIAILAAILFPVFARARAKAMQNTCLSNTKEICLSLLMYCSDWDNKFVSCTTCNQYNQHPSWWDVIAPYMKNDQIGSCPTDSTAPIYTTNNGITGLSPSYSPSGNMSGIGMNFIQNPAATIMLSPMDAWSNTFGQEPRFMGGGDLAYGIPNNQIQPNPYNRHNGGENWGHADGHAKFYTCPTLSTIIDLSDCLVNNLPTTLPSQYQAGFGINCN